MIRRLGRSDIHVSPIGFGTWAIGGIFWSGEVPVGWGEVDDQESIRAIHGSLDLGVNFFDTADEYGAGHSERILGQALAGRRSQAVISTKFGKGYDENTRKIGDSFASPEYIREACDRSLKRLNTDYIDLYLFHLSWFPVKETGPVLQVLEDLVKVGKIRAFGWSTDDPIRARFFAREPHCTAIEFQENALDDNAEMVEVCNHLDLAGINRGPLAMGLLTGKYSVDSIMGNDDVRGINSPDWVKYFRNGRPNPEWVKRLDAIRDVLTSNGRTVSQGALAWLWARSPLMIPIPGMRTIKQVEENACAMQFGPLSPDQMREIERLIPKNNRSRSKLARIIKRGLSKFGLN